MDRNPDLALREYVNREGNLDYPKYIIFHSFLARSVVSLPAALPLVVTVDHEEGSVLSFLSPGSNCLYKCIRTIDSPCR